MVFVRLLVLLVPCAVVIAQRTINSTTTSVGGGLPIPANLTAQMTNGNSGSGGLGWGAGGPGYGGGGGWAHGGGSAGGGGGGTSKGGTGGGVGVSSGARGVGHSCTTGTCGGGSAQGAYDEKATKKGRKGANGFGFGSGSPGKGGGGGIGVSGGAGGGGGGGDRLGGAGGGAAAAAGSASYGDGATNSSKGFGAVAGAGHVGPLPMDHANETRVPLAAGKQAWKTPVVTAVPTVVQGRAETKVKADLGQGARRVGAMNSVKRESVATTGRSKKVSAVSSKNKEPVVAAIPIPNGKAVPTGIPIAVRETTTQETLTVDPDSLQDRRVRLAHGERLPRIEVLQRSAPVCDADDCCLHRLGCGYECTWKQISGRYVRDCAPRLCEYKTCRGGQTMRKVGEKIIWKVGVTQVAEIERMY